MENQKNIVDARGLTCPKPVIKTKQALSKLEGNILIVLVDNSTAVANVSKFARSANCNVMVEERNKNEFVLTLIKEQREILIEETKTSNIAIFIGADIMGRGDEKLGHILAKGFLYTLTEIEPKPKSIIFANSGVKISTSDKEDVIIILKELEKQGIKIISCGTCLDYFYLKENLKVGEISNMYEIVETLLDADKVISI